MFSKTGKLFTLQGVMGSERKWKKHKKIFDENIFVSNNFVTKKTGDVREVPTELFGKYQKPVYHMLIIKEKGQMKTMLIDQREAEFFRNKLHLDKASDKDSEERSRKVALYDIRNGVVAEGKNGFADGELEKDPQFIKLLSQIKFFNGDVDYNQGQINALSTWIKKQGVKKMQSNFEEILAYHTDSRTKYRTSIIGHLFKRLAQEEV
jgi:hypothetical protein